MADEHRPMRVLHVAETLPGGIATYLRELLPLQQATAGGGQIRVLAPQDQLSHLGVLRGEMLRGYSRSGRNLRSLWNLLTALRCQVREFNPQIVHLHSSFAGGIGRLLRPLLPRTVRLVYCPHGWAFSRDDSRVARMLYILLERLLARRADAWVAISRHEMDAAAEAGIDTTQACLIYNGIGDSQGQQSATVPALDAGYKNFLFVGRHDRQKGLDTLLSAMARLQAERVRLYIAGEGVVDRPAKQENSSNIIWLGWLTGPELLGYYRACDAVVLPSRWEGFGLVAIEAMAAGKAVIATRVGGLGEIVDDHRTGRLVAAESPAELAQVLAEASRDEMKKWGGAGREKYVEKYDVSRTSRELSSLYQRLIRNI